MRDPGRALKQTTTDSTGRDSLTFENGTGNYRAAVASPGHKSARRRVQRQLLNAIGSPTLSSAPTRRFSLKSR